MINGHVTTELTSKKLKLCLVFGWILLLGGIGVAVAAAAYTDGPKFVLGGVAAFAFGFVWLVVTKILIWIHHG